MDGQNDAPIETANRIKGKKRGRRPFGMVLSAERLGEVIDAGLIGDDVI